MNYIELEDDDSLGINTTCVDDELLNGHIIQSFKEVGIELWRLIDMFISTKRCDNDKFMFSDAVLELKLERGIRIIDIINCVNEEIRDFTKDDGVDSVAVKIFKELMTVDLTHVFHDEMVEYGYLKKPNTDDDDLIIYSD